MNLIKYFRLSFVFVITIAILNLLPNSLSGQNKSLEKAWESFIANDNKNAINHFKRAANDKSVEKEALSMLSLISEYYKTNEESFSWLKKLYSTEGDINPYLFVLWSYDMLSPYVNGNLSKEHEEFFLLMLSEDRINESVRAMLNMRLAQLYHYTRKYDEAKKYYEAIGNIHKWQAAGTFENISASGFDKRYEPIDKPEGNHIFKAKNGADIQWFNLDKQPIGWWVNFDFHMSYDNSIIYGQTFCYSPKTQEVQLRMGADGSVRVWVNDKLVLSEIEERSNNIDSYIQNIKLNEGYNRILVQIGSSIINASNYTIRITDKNGKPIEGLSYEMEYQAYNKETEFNSKAEKHFAVTYFEDMLKEKPDDLFSLMMLFNTYLAMDQEFEAKAINLKLAKMAGRCSYINALKIRMHSTYDNNQAISRIAETIRATEPNGQIANAINYNETFSNENYREAERFLDLIEKKEGKSINVYNKRIDIAFARDQVELVISLIEEAYEKYPNIYTFVNYKVLVEKNVRNDNEAAVQVLLKYLESNHDHSASVALSDLYFEMGNNDDGFAVIDELIETNPIGTGNFYRKAEQHFRFSNYSKAREYYQKALELAPYVSLYYARIGNTYEEENKNKQAVEYYNTAINLHPTDYETRRKILDLLKKKLPFEYFDFKEDDVYKMVEKAPDASKYPDDNSLIVLDERQNVIYKGGAAEEKRIFAVKVFNPTGVDNWKEHRISVFPNQYLNVEKAEVVKENGNRIRAETRYNHIVFTNLEPGDAIVIIYRKENYYSGVLSNHFWDKHFFTRSSPYLLSRYSILIEGERDFNYKLTRSDMMPKVKSTGDFKRYTWEKKNQPGIKAESYLPRLVDIGTVLHISSFPDWQYINNWYYDLSRTKAVNSFEVKQVRDSLIGNENISEREKAQRIYDYIVKNIRYSSVSFRQSGLIPQSATKVINTKIGDCKDVATLFVALANEAGLKANIVLINTRDQGREDLIIPSISFNHAIVRVFIDGEPYYVELTTEYNPFATTGINLKNSFALDITKFNEVTEPFYLNPHTRVGNYIERETRIRFENDVMFVEKLNTSSGEYAASMRNSYRDDGDRERRRRLQRAITSQHTSISITELTFRDCLYNTDETVTYKYVYENPSPFSTVGNMKLIQIPWSDKESSLDFISDRDRQFPVDFWRYINADYQKESIVIEIPSGYKLVEIPESINISNPIASYTMNFEIKDNELQIVRDMKITKDHISLEELESFSSFFREVLKYDEMQIAIRPE